MKSKQRDLWIALIMVVALGMFNLLYGINQYLKAKNVELSSSASEEAFLLLDILRTLPQIFFWVGMGCIAIAIHIFQIIRKSI